MSTIKVIPNALILLPAVVLVAACTVGPDYVRPDLDAGEDFGNRTADYDAAEPESAWWLTLGDATLSQLVGDALVANHDLRVAQANVMAARAFLNQDQLNAYPIVTAAGSVTRNRASTASQQTGDRSATFYDAGFDAAWELDFFGRVRRSIEASGANYEASIAEQQDVAVTVAAEVARAFIELRGAQYRLDVARRNAVNQRQTYELTLVLAESGRSTDLDTARARAQLETTLASIEPLESVVSRSIHRLGVLTGRRPGDLTEQLSVVAPLPAMPAQVAVGEPADLLRRRADIRAAERRLAAATAQIGVATADLFPRVTLLGSAGYLATSGDALGGDGSEFTSIGPFISWPAFDLGRVRAQIRVADAGAEARLAAYEQTVLIALEEVENSLVEYARAATREARLQVASTSSERAVELARARYQAGIDSFLNVLDAEQRMLEAQTLLAEAGTDRGLAFVALYKALGGGWENLPGVSTDG